MQNLWHRSFYLMCVINLVTSESKDCDPKKDSGCMKFTRPFYPDECWAAFPGGPNCTRFDPMKSKTLKYVDKGMFLLQYADNSALKGYEARDVVQLGDYYTFTKFGMYKSIFLCSIPSQIRLHARSQVVLQCATLQTFSELMEFLDLDCLNSSMCVILIHRPSV